MINIIFKPNCKGKPLQCPMYQSQSEQQYVPKRITWIVDHETENSHNCDITNSGVTNWQIPSIPSSIKTHQDKNQFMVSYHCLKPSVMLLTLNLLNSLEMDKSICEGRKEGKIQKFHKSQIIHVLSSINSMMIMMQLMMVKIAMMTMPRTVMGSCVDGDGRSSKGKNHE